jgi:hypothetical protein
MESIKFKYSIPQMIFSVLKLIFCAVLGYLIAFDTNPGASWNISDSLLELIFKALILLLIIWFVYLSVYFYVPCLKGEVAMELDEQKLKYNIKGKFRLTKIRESIYWKDIKSISYDSLPSANVAIIRVKMKDGDKLGLPIQNVAGNDELIFNKIVEYFEKYK